MYFIPLPHQQGSSSLNFIDINTLFLVGFLPVIYFTPESGIWQEKTPPDSVPTEGKETKMFMISEYDLGKFNGTTLFKGLLGCFRDEYGLKTVVNIHGDIALARAGIAEHGNFFGEGSHVTL